MLGDGAPLTLTGSGAGTGKFASQPATITLGSSSTGFHLGGFIRDFKVSRSVCR